MAQLTQKELLDAGAHFGHLKRKWNPKMAPYIFMEKNGIHIIDLNKTIAKTETARAALKQMAKSGKKILFVATKKQAKNSVAEIVKGVNMPYVTERWPGGMLTNFATIRKSIRKMASIEKMKTDGTYDNISKRERLQFERQKEKLEKELGSIADLTRLPAALFVVDIMREHIAIKEAKKLNIPTFAIVDTNSDPTLVDFPIPANDDATRSIAVIMESVISGVKEGLDERKKEKDKEAAIAEKEGKSTEAKGAAKSKDAEGKKGKTPTASKSPQPKKVEVKEEKAADAPTQEASTEATAETAEDVKAEKE
ncbi:MAG: 30S ribosomal protein S2 [Flavobacteriales bacterium]|nr:30S ribosomal protein S2 [Flavobacteriales bacterium]